MIVATGGPDASLRPDDVRELAGEAFAALDLDGRSLCLVVPDATRVCPLPLLLGAITDAVRDRVTSCTALVALGTHAPLSDEALRVLVGTPGLTTRNHEWWDDATFIALGELTASQVGRLSGGRLAVDVPVRINRLVADSDVTVTIGPVLPHEVAGFSGGDKYLFPGVSGPELIDVSHWLGALVTSREIIGAVGTTPVRALIEAAADLVPGERHALCVVGDHDGGLRFVAMGASREAWAAATEVAAVTHVRYLDAPVERVVSLVPERYDDLWTGAKGFYKVEPVVADGGEVVLVAPHIHEIASTHPGLEQIGYHCRDYFLAHWDDHRHRPWGELAHSTHLYGAGTYDPVEGEHQRVRVTLATGIPEALVRRVNLGHLDPRTIDLAELARDPGTLVVPDAGEVLYRLRPGGR